MKKYEKTQSKTKSLNYHKMVKYIGITFSSLMVSLFPLFLTERYFNIRHDKLYLFYILSGLLTICVAVATILLKSSAEAEKLKPKISIKDFSITDFAVIAFAFSAVVSTAFSDYPLYSITGEAGRNNGLILIIFYTLVYFIISRIYKENRVVPILMSLTSAVVSFIAILQQFYWDPLNLYAGLGSSQIGKFISTLGNRNILSAYLCITLPVSFLMFIYSKKPYMLAIGGISTAVTFAGVICCNSDSSILGTGVFIIFCFIFFIRNIKQTSRLFFLIGFMLVGCKALRFFSYIMDDYSMRFSNIQHLFIYSDTYMAIVITFIIAVALLFAAKKYPQYKSPKIVQYITVGIFLLIFAGVIALIIYYSIFDTKTRLTGVMSYLRFNDSWGTHRGFMWTRAIYIFAQADIFQKIFGFGPDTFGTAMDIFGYNNELMSYKNEVTNCAHNVYLNYLVTVGFAGALSYITMIISVFVRGIKRAAKNKYAVIFAGSIICYSVQSVVNIDQPITTPIFILMIGIAESQNRKIKVNIL